MSEYRTLIIDDEVTYTRSLQRLLQRRGLQVDVASTAAEGLLWARRRSYTLILLDHLLPDGTGLDLIGPLRAIRPAPAVLMMTAYGTIENAVEAMRRGATDYVPKSTALPEVVNRVVEAEQVARATRAAQMAPPQLATELLGESPALREAILRIQEVARAPDTTVLLCGESGTGKGVAARAIHALSQRASEPFVAIDCVALPAPLAESELFGYEKGAFTGAERQKPGRLEVAGRGTVLLDEIGDMDPALQGKLLRVLEERTFERVGGVRPIALEARMIAASHRDLAQLVGEKRFRLDLYHRLSVFPIHLPPLRERGEDILLLANYFAAEFGNRLGKRVELSREVRELLLRYDFPGNVRELRNIIERAVILAPDGASQITPDLLPPRITEAALRRHLVTATPPGSPVAGLTVTFEPGRDTLERLERRLLEEALRMAGGRKNRAAELLGISRFALLRRVEKYGL
ncbi:MAG: sigma-54 dependent transcriptional regulator [Myxococcales bacterium]|nr:sigma-54 dependent transcriptional regulator [Myxococcota bacterium]MDW8282408.1 sigma-54 dependent transcriptional regulator [Myxococcales bacterium]